MWKIKIFYNIERIEMLEKPFAKRNPAGAIVATIHDIGRYIVMSDKFLQRGVQQRYFFLNPILGLFKKMIYCVEKLF